MRVGGQDSEIWAAVEVEAQHFKIPSIKILIIVVGTLIGRDLKIITAILIKLK